MTSWRAWRERRADPRRAVRIAAGLWLVLAIVVWNVVFDRVLVLAGRRFVHAAAVADASGQPYLLLDPWMREAAVRGVWLATAAAAVVAALGALALRVAWVRSSVSPHPSPRFGPSAPVVPAAE